jgi:uncharacterized FAD-dependent dehydrogenase
MLRLTNIKVRIDEAVDTEGEKQILRNKILSMLRIREEELKSFKIAKKSIDARKKDKIFYVYNVDIELIHEKKLLDARNKGLIPTPDLLYKQVKPGTELMAERPVIVGMGPAGLFAALLLARSGYRPILLERGDDVDTRAAKINNFWREGTLDTESNVQFGEGGAGTFSDGKLTTLINDKRCGFVLQEFVAAGAPEEILYMNKPHIGTDLLRTVVKNIRKEIIANGGEVRFRAKATDFIIKEGKIKAVAINDNENLYTNILLLAIGHSARDTYEVLYKRGVAMKPKAFSIGVRIEHPQEFINKIQYGSFAGTAGLRAADYKMSYHSKSGRSAYTFCMCPGGYVVAATSEQCRVVTNGMSEYKRDGKNGNAALLVGVTPADFPGEHPLAGIEFQRKWEYLAYVAGGRNYMAPAQLVGDFLAGRASTNWGAVEPTYRPGVVLTTLEQCLPRYVIDTIKEAIVYFDTKMKGFAMPDSILTGVETRSSSPVRITRNENFQSNIEGIYPVGEGAGYAGGIMSSIVDGIKTAEEIIQRYAPIQKSV